MKNKLLKILIIIFMFFVSAGIVYAIDNSSGVPNLEFASNTKNCKEILGPNLTKVVHAGIKAIQIIGAITAIVKGMIVLFPAIIAKDADELHKAGKILTTMAIILAVIFLMPGLLRFIGKVAGFDISCIF